MAKLQLPQGEAARSKMCAEKERANKIMHFNLLPAEFITNYMLISIIVL